MTISRQQIEEKFFKYRRPSDDSVEAIRKVRDKAKSLALEMYDFSTKIKDKDNNYNTYGEEFHNALNSLRESVAWFDSHILLNIQVKDKRNQDE